MSNSATKITINDKQSLSYEEVTSLLQNDTSSLNITVIESTKTDVIDNYEFADGMKLEPSNLEPVDIVLRKFEKMSQSIWDVAEIVWNKNTLAIAM